MPTIVEVGGDAGLGVGNIHMFAVKLDNVAGQWYNGGRWTIPTNGIYKITYDSYGHNCVISDYRFIKNDDNVGKPNSITCVAGDVVGYDAYAWFENSNQRGCCGYCCISGPFEE